MFEAIAELIQKGGKGWTLKSLEPINDHRVESHWYLARAVKPEYGSVEAEVRLRGQNLEVLSHLMVLKLESVAQFNRDREANPEVAQ